MPDDLEIRPVTPADDPALGAALRRIMAECGTLAPNDPELAAMSISYGRPGATYLVAHRGEAVLGGAGIAPLTGGPPDVCELRKMYLDASVRGTGIGRQLLEQCLRSARELGYRRCYLETMAGMARARALYERHGFARTDTALASQPSRCNTYYLLELTP